MFSATRDASHAGRGVGAPGGRTTQQATRADPGPFGRLGGTLGRLGGALGFLGVTLGCTWGTLGCLAISWDDFGTISGCLFDILMVCLAFVHSSGAYLIVLLPQQAWGADCLDNPGNPGNRQTKI